MKVLKMDKENPISFYLPNEQDEMHKHHWGSSIPYVGNEGSTLFEPP